MIKNQNNQVENCKNRQRTHRTEGSGLSSRLKNSVVDPDPHSTFI